MTDEVRRAIVASAIAAFAWDNFGLNAVQETIQDGSTEWIAALADKVVRTLTEEVGPTQEPTR